MGSSLPNLRWSEERGVGANGIMGRCCNGFWVLLVVMALLLAAGCSLFQLPAYPTLLQPRDQEPIKVLDLTTDLRG